MGALSAKPLAYSLDKLLRGTQSALPVVPQFRAALAHGVGLSVPALDETLRDLQSCGVLLGFRGELSLGLQGTAVRFGEIPPEGLPAHGALRWIADSAEGRIGSWLSFDPGSDAATGSPDFVKCGWLLPWPQSGPEELLVPMRERTPLVDPTEPPVPMPRDPVLAGLGALLAHPIACEPGREPWDQLAASLGIDPAHALEGLKRLLRERVFRRFHFLFSPAGLGFEGCELATWELPKDSLGEGKAQALAAFAGTGEVATLRPNGAERAMLTAVVLGQHAGGGAAAARAMAQRVGLPEPQLRSITPFPHAPTT